MDGLTDGWTEKLDIFQIGSRVAEKNAWQLYTYKITFPILNIYLLYGIIDSCTNIEMKDIRCWHLHK